MEEDINAFRSWATNLGCPPDAIPNEDALKSIFKSRQRELFCNLMKRVQPRQDVQALRENILINRMLKLKDQVVPTSERSFLPKELQAYLKIKDLTKKKEEMEAVLEEHKRDYDSLAGIIKTKNMHSIHLNQKQQILEAKVNILELKSEALDKDIKIEQENRDKIMSNMPVKLSAKNASETVAKEAVETAIKELEAFYNVYVNDNNLVSMEESKEAIWRKMRSIFANIPNFLIFSSIMRLKEEHLQNIMSLSKSTVDDPYARSVISASKEPFTAFELKLMQAKADLLGLVAKYLTSRQERIVLEERFSEAYIPFVDELQKRMNLFNSESESEERIDAVISDYIVQYNLRNFNRTQNEFLSQQIEVLKAEIATNAKQLENHEVLLGSIKQVYSDINDSVNRIQYEVMQLGQIKDKILYSKNMLRRMLTDLQASVSNTGVKANFLPTKLNVNINNSNSTITGESFELGGDNVFCSTQLDLDTTLVSLNNTTLGRSFGGGANATLLMPPTTSGEGRFSLPAHLMEFNIFADIPLEQFSCIPRECAFYLSPNPLIAESRELSSVLQLAPGILLTPFGALQEVRNRIVWADLIKKHANDSKLDLELIMVDTHSLKEQSKKQHEHIAEFLDKVDVVDINTNRTLQKADKIYNFILDNPLRQFIPATKCFNNQNYADYEAEYTVYHRMATIGSSIK